MSLTWTQRQHGRAIRYDLRQIWLWCVWSEGAVRSGAYSRRQLPLKQTALQHGELSDPQNTKLSQTANILVTIPLNVCVNDFFFTRTGTDTQLWCRFNRRWESLTDFPTYRIDVTIPWTAEHPRHKNWNLGGVTSNIAMLSLVCFSSHLNLWTLRKL